MVSTVHMGYWFGNTAAVCSDLATRRVRVSNLRMHSRVADLPFFEFVGWAVHVLVTRLLL